MVDRQWLCDGAWVYGVHRLNAEVLLGLCDGVWVYGVHRLNAEVLLGLCDGVWVYGVHRLTDCRGTAGAVWWCVSVWCPQTECRGTAGAAAAAAAVVAVSSVPEVIWNFISACVQISVLLHHTVIVQSVTPSHCHTVEKLCSVCLLFYVTFYIVLVFCTDLLECFCFYTVQLFCCLALLWERGLRLYKRKICFCKLLLLCCHMLEIILFSLFGIYMREITRY